MDLSLRKRAGIKLRILLSRLKRGLGIRFYVWLRLYPRYAQRLLLQDNPNLRSSGAQGLHLFLMEGSGLDRDSVRFIWIRRALTEESNISLIKLGRDTVFDRLAQFVMSRFHRVLRTGKGEFDFPHLEYSKSKYEKEKQRYRALCKQIIQGIHDRWRIDAIVSGSAGDTWCKEAIVAARELGIPWVVLHREAVVLPANFDYMPDHFKRYYPFDVDLYLTASQDHAALFHACGLDWDRLRIVGEPRSDFWSAPDLWKSRREVHPDIQEDKILLLYFGFGPLTYLGKTRFPHEQRDWRNLVIDHERILTEIAATYSERLQIVWKGGHTGDVNSALGQRLQDRGIENVLLLSSAYSAQELLTNADIIVGFQSTALLEAMFTSRPIVYGGWGELHDELVDRLLPLHQTPAVIHAKSADGMLQALTGLLDGGPPFQVGQDVLDARKEFKERYFHKPDGNVGKRILEEIRALVAGSDADDTQAASPEDGLEKTAQRSHG